MPADKTPGEVAHAAYECAMVKVYAGSPDLWTQIHPNKRKVFDQVAQAVREQLETEQANVDPREDLPGTLRRARKIVAAWRNNLEYESPGDAIDNATEALEDVEALLD